MTPRSLFATADEVNAFRNGAVAFRRPARSASGLWLQAGDKPGKVPYVVGDRVCIREPFADTPTGRVFRADTQENLKWQRADALPIIAARYRFEVVSIRIEPLHTTQGFAEGVAYTRFWTPKELDDRPFEEKWWDDNHFWLNYPRIAYARWWDSMWARFGIGWETNPMTWVVTGREIDRFHHTDTAPQPPAVS